MVEPSSLFAPRPNCKPLIPGLRGRFTQSQSWQFLSGIVLRDARGRRELVLGNAGIWLQPPAFAFRLSRLGFRIGVFGFWFVLWRAHKAQSARVAGEWQ